MADTRKMPWIKLWKKSDRNSLYFEEPFDKWHAWQDLLLLADYSGTVKTSLRRLKTRWNWTSVRQVVKHLETLSETGQITINGTPSGTVITIVKWGKYQKDRSKSETPKNAKSGTVSGTKKNIKEDGEGTSLSSSPTSRENEFDITAGDFDD